MVLSHRVYPKKYMQALTKVVMGNWGGLQDNSLLVALTCLYEESLIDSQIGTIRLVQLL